jgi:acyl-CoA synthetase (NDP forming)
MGATVVSGSRAGVISRLRHVDSVAIVGASPVKGRIGYELVRNIVNFGFEGGIYPVNPKYGEVLGLKCYSTVREVPGKVGLAVVAVPAPSVIGVVNDLCYKDVDVVVVVSSGFREKGRVELEDALRRAAGECGMRIIGPNSAGVTSSPSRLHASIEILPTPGRIAVLSHSGAVGGVAIHELQKYGSGVSYFISLGNSVDVGLEEVVEELAGDPYTEAVVVYAEWVKEGRRFMDALMKLSKSKPVAVVKGGWGRVSSTAVLSHTGGMAASYEVFRAAVRQAGGFLAEEVEEAVASVEALRKLGNLGTLNRVLVVTNSGGYGILTASHLERADVELPEVSRELLERLKQLVGKEITGSNPLDLGGDAMSEDVGRILTALELRSSYDLAVVAYVPTSAEHPETICESFKKVAESIPTIYLVAGGGSEDLLRCLSKSKPVTYRPLYLSKLISELARNKRRVY